jgi:Protein of unknown function (DUF2934)
MLVSRDDAVRELAYRLWAARDRQHGFDLQDWLDAERLIGDSEGPSLAGDDPEPPIKVPNPPEEEVDDVLREAPKVGSRDAPGG